MKVVIWGASGHARVVADALTLGGSHQLVGFLDDVSPERRGSSFHGLPVLGGREVLASLRASGVEGLIFGFGNCAARLRLAPEVRGLGIQLVTVVHPSAVVARDVVLGPGTLVAAGAVINTAARVGENVIVNTSASVDHDAIVEDGVHLCPGVRVGGLAHVETGAWVGIGSTISDRVRVGARAMLGAGSVVVRDIPADVLAYGVPARVIRRIESHG